MYKSYKSCQLCNSCTSAKKNDRASSQYCSCQARKRQARAVILLVQSTRAAAQSHKDSQSTEDAIQAAKGYGLHIEKQNNLRPPTVVASSAAALTDLAAYSTEVPSGTVTFFVTPSSSSCSQASENRPDAFAEKRARVSLATWSNFGGN